MLRFASLAILTLTAGLSFGCEDKAATPSPEKAAATTADTKPAEPEAKPAETEKPAEDKATEDKPADDKTAEDQKAAEPADDKAAKPEAKTAEKAGAAKAEPAAEKPAEEKKGAEATGDSFGAYLAGGKYTAGKPGTLTAVLTAKGEYHCNDKYPYKFTLDPAPAGVTFPETVVKGMNVSEKRSTMAIPFTPSEKGAKTISGTLAFSVCNADRCLIEKQKLTITVNVN
ncbi:MAG: hypothetical protein H6718_22335 [Polyangiaceae bacterium]|nr:hypothetical protein [Myxococcales bacterium]MCB9588163.1 hypothetical protein [Polyangiaceae bacterium]